MRLGESIAHFPHLLRGDARFFPNLDAESFVNYSLQELITTSAFFAAGSWYSKKSLRGTFCCFTRTLITEFPRLIHFEWITKVGNWDKDIFSTILYLGITYLSVSLLLFEIKLLMVHRIKIFDEGKKYYLLFLFDVSISLHIKFQILNFTAIDKNNDLRLKLANSTI